MPPKQVAPAPILRCPKKALWLEYDSKAQDGRGRWYSRVPAEHGISDVLSPDYFGMHIGERGFREGDTIEIEPESALWVLQVRVMAILPNLQQVVTRESVNMRQEYEVKPPAGYKFAWEGEKKRWAIYKGETCVDAGFITQDEAMARISELQHEKAA